VGVIILPFSAGFLLPNLGLKLIFQPAYFKGINFEKNMIFDNRKNAGRLLGEWLKEKLGEEGNYIVLGIPRGGVVVAKETAEVLGAPLGVLIVRKLGVPENPELAFGAIDPDGNIYLDKSTVEYFGLTPQVIQKVAQEELKKIREREKKFERGL
jgi:putative phosphoribosyl transferase